MCSVLTTAKSYVKRKKKDYNATDQGFTEAKCILRCRLFDLMLLLSNPVHSISKVIHILYFANI